jgi:hypothetical protein
MKIRIGASNIVKVLPNGQNTLGSMWKMSLVMMAGLEEFVETEKGNSLVRSGIKKHEFITNARKDENTKKKNRNTILCFLIFVCPVKLLTV